MKARERKKHKKTKEKGNKSFKIFTVFLFVLIRETTGLYIALCLYSFNVYFLKIFFFHIFQANLVPKFEGLQIN